MPSIDKLMNFRLKYLFPGSPGFKWLLGISLFTLLCAGLLIARCQQEIRNQFTWALAASLLLALLAQLLILRKMRHKEEQRSTIEDKLQRSESKYRNLIDNVNGVIYSADLDGQIEFASAGVKTLTGYTPDEMAGQDYSFLVDPSCLAEVSAHYRNQLQAGIKETALEFRMINRSGKKKWVEQLALLLEKDGQPTGFQCFVRDISEKKQMQQDLEAYESRLKENQILLVSILNNTTAIVYVKNIDGKYMLANRRFLEVLQTIETQVIGHTDYDLVTPQLADHYKALDDKVLQTGSSIQTEERLPAGKEGDTHIHFLITKFPLKDNENKIIGIGGIATDITERVRFQQQLISANIEAEDARKMQEQFLANMSHEIRTPMNGIQGMINLLMETALTHQQQEFASVIQQSADNLLVIINDILDLSKIKAGKLAMERIDFHLQDVISNIHSLFAHRVKKKNLLFEIRIDPAIPKEIQGDPHRLNQVLINLVGNAVKFTEKGRIRLTAALEAFGPQSVDLAFTVEDSGIGIPKDILPYVFESFSQASVAISRKYGGTGLGLAICHQLIALQGGCISVTSQEGEGTTFSFRLSYGHSVTGGQVRHIPASSQDFSALLAGKHFLVVEDNPVNQKLMDLVVRKAGGRVTLASNGQEAIPCLEAYLYDLIIMDLQMPVMDGYETTKYIRNILRLHTPVMAMTANAINGEQLRCLEAGMNDYMSKPFDFKEFYRHVADLLRNAGPIASRSKEKDYSLSLLEEVGDEDYIQDILSCFLSTVPDQMTELQQANAAKDYDKLFLIAHRLKGSTGMMQATALTENLSRLEQLSREKTDASDLVHGTMILFEELIRQLEMEKRSRIAQAEKTSR